jgi:hypothetical protein
MGDLPEPHLRPKYSKDELCLLVVKYEKFSKEIAKLRNLLSENSNINQV